MAYNTWQVLAALGLPADFSGQRLDPLVGTALEWRAQFL
jgi:hypothetical protein